MRSLFGYTNGRNFLVVAMLLMLSGLAALTHAEAGSIGAARSVGSERPSPEGQSSIAGTWKIDRYVLRDGRTPRVDGSILFTESGWAVLLFIVDEDGEPRRGSGEGGTYTVDGDRLTFSHRYNMSGGEAIEGYDASDWSLTLREPEAAVSEACTIELTADRLTIHFPSGNRLEFSRSSA
jgi:hypothetical protein